MNERDVIELAREAYRRHWQATSDESTGDKQAQRLTKAWQSSLEAAAPGRFLIEAPLGAGLGERIDVVDPVERVAFELKASGKNSHHEFYRDLFKVLVYNRRNQPPLKKFIFITEASGITRLQRGLGLAVVEFTPEVGLSVTLASF